MNQRTLIAIGGGGFSTGSALALDDALLALTGKAEATIARSARRQTVRAVREERLPARSLHS